MRELTEKDAKLKQQVLESPAHQKVKGNRPSRNVPADVALGLRIGSVVLCSPLRLPLVGGARRLPWRPFSWGGWGPPTLRRKGRKGVRGL